MATQQSGAPPSLDHPPFSSIIDAFSLCFSALTTKLFADGVDRQFSDRAAIYLEAPMLEAAATEPYEEGVVFEHCPIATTANTPTNIQPVTAHPETLDLVMRASPNFALFESVANLLGLANFGISH